MINTRTFGAWSILAMALAGVPSPAAAGVTNTETGEHYQPGVDEHGNPEEPPEWVYGNTHQTQTSTPTSTSTQPTVLANDDVCDRPISDWIITATPNLEVSQAILDANTHTAFINAFEVWGTHAVAIQVAGLGMSLLGFNISAVTPGNLSVNRFSCSPSSYSLIDCLNDGFDMWYCKTHAIMSAQPTGSDVELAVPLTISFFGALPVTGTMTIEGGLSYRETDNHDLDPPLEEICIEVADTTFDGFGLLTGTVRNAFESTYLRPDGSLCVGAPLRPTLSTTSVQR